MAIVIFAVGMLALASLQGNLARSSSDSNARTVAVNFVEELIEDHRTYEGREADGSDNTYQEIVDTTITNTRAGYEYRVDVAVQDWFILDDGVTLTMDTDDLPSGRDPAFSDFKFVEYRVRWSAPDFQRGDGSSAETRFGSGDFTVSTMVPSLPIIGGAKIAAVDDGKKGTPPVAYTPGERPEIVSLMLDSGKFKESTRPEPEVRRRDELVETWFDVVTFSTTGDDSIFLRREEYVSISCECELVAPSGGVADGREPTTWTGAQWDEGDLIGKASGVQASRGSGQSQYCVVCCRDHHDSTSSSLKFRPWMVSDEYVSSGPFAGDHPHYDRNHDGDPFEVTTAGDTYQEACRLIRKDGFFRVAQDFQMHEINAFPQNYLISSGDVTEYSNYVRAIVDSELGGGSEPAPAPESLTFDGRDTANRTSVPVDGSGGVTQQLRSRGIYVDVMNPALQANIDNCFGGGDRADCEAPLATSVFELYPFFDVQLTFLGRWDEAPHDNPVDITNEEIDTGPSGYSRGVASLAEADSTGGSTGTSTIEDSNAGLISIVPSMLIPTPVYGYGEIFLSANGDGTDPPPSGDPTISGTLGAEGGTSEAAALTLTGSAGVSCGKPTVETWVCVIDPAEPSTPMLTVSNYFKAHTNLIICSPSLTTDDYNLGTDSLTNWTRFILPTETTTGVSLVISKFPC